MKKQLMDFFEQIVAWIKDQLQNLNEWQDAFREAIMKFLKDVYEIVRAELGKVSETVTSNGSMVDMPKNPGATVSN